MCRTIIKNNVNEYAERQTSTKRTEQEMHKLNEQGDGLSPHFTEKDHKIVLGDPPFRCFFYWSLCIYYYSTHPSRRVDTFMSAWQGRCTKSLCTGSNGDGWQWGKLGTCLPWGPQWANPGTCMTAYQISTLCSASCECNLCIYSESSY